MLDCRLSTIASLIRKNSYVCDVGTDHAYLPCFLVKNNITNRCVACDINEKPLEIANKHIAQYEYEQEIEVIVSDGLKNIPSQKAEDIVIAGMGGELITQILLGVDYTKDTSKRFILQPMTQVGFLREKLYQNGFFIASETPVLDKNHCYTIMQVEYNGIIEQPSELFLALGKIPQHLSNESQVYIKRQYDKTISIANGLDRSQLQKKQAKHYFDLAKQIETYIKKGE